MALRTICTACGAGILLTTAAKRGGLCAPCANGTRAQIDAARKRVSEPDQLRSPPPVVDPSASAITNALHSIADPDDAGDLATLEGALAALPQAPDAVRCIPALFGVFERFPWSDGFGGFSGILHSLETLPGYESELVASVRRAPGAFITE